MRTGCSALRTAMGMTLVVAGLCSFSFASPRGDASDDGVLDAADVKAMTDHIEDVQPLSFQTALCADLTGDGLVTVDDLAELLNILDDTRQSEDCSLVPPIDSVSVIVSVFNRNFDTDTATGFASNSVSVRNTDAGQIVAGGYIGDVYTVSNTIFVGAGYAATMVSVRNTNADRLVPGGLVVAPVSVFNSEFKTFTAGGITGTSISTRNLVTPPSYLGNLDGLPPVSVENTP